MNPKPWPWNKLGKPCPADWGVGLTICIAAVCAHKGEEAIICVSDRKVSMGGYYSADQMITKTDPVGDAWVSMFSGDDMSSVVPILERIRSKSMVHYDEENTVSKMSDIVVEAYQTERKRRVEQGLLSRFSLDTESFNKIGQQVLGHRHAAMCDKISNYDLKCQLLMAGFDNKQHGHVFTVSNPGECENYDKINFWAIGSGEHAALSQLFFFGYIRNAPLRICVYQVLVAKYMAESAEGVGPNTFALVMHNADCVSLIQSEVEAKVIR